MNLAAALTQVVAARKAARKPKAALMTHVVLGYPSLRESIELVRTMADAGASLVELQIPFSDPMADGPTIMRANELALEQGVRPLDCFRAAEKLARAVHAPLLFMSYYNILFSYGEKKRRAGRDAGCGVAQFCRDAKSAGVQGLIVPDVPYHLVRDEYWELAGLHGLAPIPVVAPVTTDKRLKELSTVAKNGFVYCVSATRTTGARDALPKELHGYLRRVKKYFKSPRAVGFGISSPSHVRLVAREAEIAVVGSATIDIINKASPKARQQQVEKFIRSLVES